MFSRIQQFVTDGSNKKRGRKIISTFDKRYTEGRKKQNDTEKKAKERN